MKLSYFCIHLLITLFCLLGQIKRVKWKMLSVVDLAIFLWKVTLVIIGFNVKNMLHLQILESCTKWGSWKPGAIQGNTTWLLWRRKSCKHELVIERHHHHSCQSSLTCCVYTKPTLIIQNVLFLLNCVDYFLLVILLCSALPSIIIWWMFVIEDSL